MVILMEGSLGSSSSFTTSATTEVEQRTGSSSGAHVHGHLPPKHPIPQLQGAFEESIHEAGYLKKEDRDWVVVDIDAQSRRRDLLENAEYERLCGRKWRQRAGERYHPFWKLTAQMSFGLHLLVQETAKSKTVVLNILQLHVDELDGFISRTTEDFLIIELDLRTRIQYLSLPLENLENFDQMLADRNFRLAMIDYNEKIELAVERFTMAIGDALKDIHKGREAIGALWQFLGQSAKENTPMSRSLTAIYNSMLANTEGWNSALVGLRRKGVALLYAITQLGRVISEMQRRVGVASRKDVVSFMQPPPPIPRVKSIRGLFDRGVSVYSSKSSMTEKPLPSDPTIARKSNQSHSRPCVRSSGRLTQKSVPNLRATVALETHQAKEKVPDRAKSVNGASSRGSDSGSMLPRLSKTLSRRLSKAKLPAKATTGDAAEEPLRPATSASRTLKSFRKSRYEQRLQQEQRKPSNEPPLPNRSERLSTFRPTTSGALAKGEAMKGQLLQYFKSDRVLDSWEGVAEKSKKPARTDTKKDGLWSIFQAKPSVARTDGLATDVFQDDIQRQMAWLEEETKNLNTYSLKPKPTTAPKFHTISEHLNSQQHADGEEHQRPGAREVAALDDDDSILTALPAFPLPPIGYRIPEIPELPG
ncbi:hypothetical protein BDV18DRAFT_149360 [Aspergillus unguis]